MGHTWKDKVPTPRRKIGIAAEGYSLAEINGHIGREGLMCVQRLHRWVLDLGELGINV